MALTPVQRRVGAGALAVSAAAVTFVALWEGDEPKPYRDTVGVLTVCNGHTGPDIVPGKTYTKKECDALLHQDLSEHGQWVLRCTKVPLNQNQYDAFVSFTFNVGPASFCNSTLVRKLNAGDYVGACNELLRWNKAGGKVVNGLTRRREAERELCLKPVKPKPAVIV